MELSEQNHFPYFISHFSSPIRETTRNTEEWGDAFWDSV